MFCTIPPDSEPSENRKTTPLECQLSLLRSASAGGEMKESGCTVVQDHPDGVDGQNRSEWNVE